VFTEKLLSKVLNSGRVDDYIPSMVLVFPFLDWRFFYISILFYLT